MARRRGCTDLLLDLQDTHNLETLLVVTLLVEVIDHILRSGCHIAL